MKMKKSRLPKTAILVTAFINFMLISFLQPQSIIDDFLNGNNTTTLRGTYQDGLITPRDLDFHKDPDRQYELWVINENNVGNRNHGGSTVTYYNAGQENQWAEYRKDSWSGHFMHPASAIAISENGTFANTLDVQDANNQGGYFTGCSLWDSDTSIYARVHQNDGMLGSHIDMIHQSPYSEGIASAGGNVYWLFDGFHNAICKYDFVAPHEEGGDNHSDGKVWRHSDVAVDRVPGLSSHLEIDPVSGWLYIADTGNQRILRMDPNSGVFAQNLPPYGESLALYWRMTGTDWNIVADTDLTYPTGLDIYDNRLLISDFSNGDIIIYDITQDPVVELGRIETGLNNEIMGLNVSPDGDIWYVCTNANQLYQITADHLLSGDLTGDGLLNISDVIRMVNIILGIITDPSEQELEAGDINADTFIDVFDVVLLVDLILGN